MPLSLPYHDEKVTQHNDEQRSSSWVDITADGTITVKSRFENAKQLDGDHYTTLVVVHGPNGPIAAVKQVEGLNARGFGRTVVDETTQSGQIPLDRLNQAISVSIDHAFWDEVNDVEFWRVVRTLAEAFMAGQDSGFKNL